VRGEPEKSVDPRYALRSGPNLGLSARTHEKRRHCSNAGGLSAVLRQRLYTLVALHSAVLCSRLPGTTNVHIKFANGIPTIARAVECATCRSGDDGFAARLRRDC
jgi:hypothetical protein